MKLQSKEGWKWYGFACHFIGGHRCQYHLATNIGDKYLVSTIGRFTPDPLNKPNEIVEIGSDRYYETYVFSINGDDKNDDPIVLDWNNILDTDGYNTSIDAEVGHYRMCDKWDSVFNSTGEQ